MLLWGHGSTDSNICKKLKYSKYLNTEEIQSRFLPISTIRGSAEIGFGFLGGVVVGLEDGKDKKGMNKTTKWSVAGLVGGDLEDGKDLKDLMGILFGLANCRLYGRCFSGPLPTPKTGVSDPTI